MAGSAASRATSARRCRRASRSSRSSCGGFPATLELGFLAIIIAVGLGIPLGYLAARRHGRASDHFLVCASLLGITIPVFFLAFMLKWVFAVQLGWLPSEGRQDPRLDATHYTGFYVLDGILTGEWDAAWDAFLHLILPAIALASIPLAIIVRITRASVLEVQNSDYVRTGMAKGISRGTIRGRFILRNACCRSSRPSACRSAC